MEREAAFIESNRGGISFSAIHHGMMESVGRWRLTDSGSIFLSFDTF